MRVCECMCVCVCVCTQARASGKKAGGAGTAPRELAGGVEDTGEEEQDEVHAADDAARLEAGGTPASSSASKAAGDKKAGARTRTRTRAA